MRSVIYIQRLNVYHWSVTVLACVFSIYSLHAQYFSGLYSDGQPVMLFGSVKAVNGSFYVTGVTAIKDKAVFAKLDCTGAPLFFKTYLDSSDSSNYLYDIFANSLKTTSDGNFIAVGSETDSIQRGFLLKVDSNGNVLLWHEYTAANNLIFHGQDIIEIPDSGYLMAVNMNISDVSNVRIVRTDLEGNVLNQRDYFSGRTALPWVIRSMHNRHYMVGASSFKNTSQTPYWAKTWLIEIDSMGNMVRQWLDTDSTNLFPNGMEQTADSGWIIVRQHIAYDINNDQAYNSSILKLDKNFNKQWEIDTGTVDLSTDMFDVKILSDGNYICAGANASNIITGDSSRIYGWLMKISASGQIIWQRFYIVDSSAQAFHSLNSIELLSDGGFVSCGQKQGNQYEPYQAGWLLRTDSNGCLIDNCWLTAIPEIEPQQVSVKVFPNPVSTFVFFQVDMTGIETEITLFDIYGRMIAKRVIRDVSQLEIDTRQWQDGLYIWRAVQQNKAIGQGKLEIIR